MADTSLVDQARSLRHRQRLQHGHFEPDFLGYMTAISGWQNRPMTEEIENW
jgi:hypothetical protein